MNYGYLKELGSSGLNCWGGVISEEFSGELIGRKGMEVYREMSENDDIVGAVLYAMEMMLRQVEWDVVAGGDGEADYRARDFVKSCMEDMEETWTDFLSEVLSFLVYGWSYHEIVYKRRMGNQGDERLGSRFDDGLIGWRKMPIRSQDSLFQWKYDEQNRLLGMVQSAPPDFAPVFIPLEKALHFKTKLRKGNPEGRSVLRNAHRLWHFKRRIQEIEGIGIERDLAGLPFLQAPEGSNIWGEEYAQERNVAEQLVKNIRADSTAGIILPHGWTLQLLSTGGKKQFDTNQVIQRYDSRIAMTMLADFILLGHEQVGSFALSSDKTAVFSMAMGTYLDIITQVLNQQGISRLIALNREHFKGISGLPCLVHGDLETQNLGDLGGFIKEMVSVGAISVDESLEEYLRRAAHLPLK